MRERRGIQKKKADEPEPATREAAPADPNEPADVVIPVCLGEFGMEEAKGFRRLWESVWPQDRRGKKEEG